jgi:cellulose 1,4-beta-cellobiosidase
MGVCCPEMDIWEANSVAQAFTSHTCKSLTSAVCTGDQCGDNSANRYNGFCDKDGCDFASYRWGAKEFYGQGKKVDTSKKFTVITQFITQGNTDDGELIEVRRMYRQNGNLIKNEAVTVKGLQKQADSLTDQFCQANKAATGDKDSFKERGGMKAMGEAMKNGMVLVLSIWDDATAKMQWLDGTYPPNGSPDKYGVKRGPCDANSGDPATLRNSKPDSKVTFSNVKIGPIDTSAEKTTPPKQKRSTFYI